MLDFHGLIQQALQALEQDRPADAEKGIRSALAVSPRDDQLLNLLGVSLVRQGREAEAIEPLRKAISLNRRDAEYHNTLGCALRNSGQMEAGIESFERAIKLDPELLDARFNLAKTCQRAGQMGRAEAELGYILARSPGDIEAISALGAQYWFLGDFERALGTYREAIGRIPQSGDLRFVLAECLLALGRWEEGWRHYLWRVNRHGFAKQLGLALDDPQLMAPLPEALAGRTLRVHAEQGIGDDLFFLRYAAELRRRGAQVHGAVTPRLMEMVRRSGALDAVEPASGRVPPSRDYLMLGDLPHLMRLFSPPPSLRFSPLPSQMESVAQRLAALPRPLIGLTWRAGTGPEVGNRNALYKELPLEEMIRAAVGFPGSLLILQRAPRADEIEAWKAACGDRVVDLSALNADLEAMHALLAQIDEYVGVSNTNMHLCAALGRTARVLVSRSVEFRWLAEGDASPWFPGFPVYRQGSKGDWGQALHRIVAQITT